MSENEWKLLEDVFPIEIVPILGDVLSFQGRTLRHSDHENGVIFVEVNEIPFDSLGVTCEEITWPIQIWPLPQAKNNPIGSM